MIVYRKFEIGVMLDEDSDYTVLGNVILSVDEEDLDSSYSTEAFYRDIKQIIADSVVIKSVEFTQPDFDFIGGL